MWLVLLSAVGVVLLALLFLSVRKAAPAKSIWKTLDDSEAAAAASGQATGRRPTEQTVPGAGTGGAVSGAQAPGATAVEVAEPAAAPTVPNREKYPRKEMWVDSYYCWVVLCKNHWYHFRQNLFFRHRIPLAETDALAPRPSIDHHFRVRCDDCGKEYIYKPSDVLRFEQQVPDSFVPHPLFR